MKYMSQQVCDVDTQIELPMATSKEGTLNMRARSGIDVITITDFRALKDNTVTRTARGKGIHLHVKVPE